MVISSLLYVLNIGLFPGTKLQAKDKCEAVHRQGDWLSNLGPVPLT